MPVPILGQTGNGRQPMHVIDVSHLIEVHTAGGGRHRLRFEFGVPVGADGTTDLAGLKSFDPQVNANGNMANQIFGARRNPQAVSMTMDDGTEVVIAHIVSWRYLGTVEQVEEAEKRAAFEAAGRIPQPGYGPGGTA